MAIDDDPFDALEKEFQMENLAVSPITSAVWRVISLLPFPWPFDKAADEIKGFVAAESLSHVVLLLKTCITELRKQQATVNQLRINESARREREQVSRELLLDAARKAEATRSKDRVKRIGLILANAVVDPKPLDPDEIE